jgi:hypothetical protein
MPIRGMSLARDGVSPQHPDRQRRPDAAPGGSFADERTRAVAASAIQFFLASAPTWPPSAFAVSATSCSSSMLFKRLTHELTCRR